MVNEGQIGNEWGQGETKGDGREVNEQWSGVNVGSVGQSEGMTTHSILNQFKIMDKTE